MNHATLLPVMLGLLSFVLGMMQLTVFAQNPHNYIVDQKHPGANDEGPGNAARPLRTISVAASRALAGDTIMVRTGIYRERVAPASGGTKDKPVVYQAAPNELVIVKGSDLWTPRWQFLDERPDVFQAPLTAAMFSDVNPYHTRIQIATVKNTDESLARPWKESVLPPTLGQLFIDGRPLTQVVDPELVTRTPGTWMVNREGTAILLHVPHEGKQPHDYTIELTVRDRIFCPFKRGLGYIHVKGFVFEHCANQGPFPQGGAISVRSGHHWLVEDNTVRYAKTIGLDCGSETWDAGSLTQIVDEDDRRLIIGGNHVIRNNLITDNGLCGIAGWNHQGSTIVGNTVLRNNRLGFLPGFDADSEEHTGIKLHCTDALIEGNIVCDNYGAGIWLDNVYTNSRVTRNVVLNNSRCGVFVELGTGPCLVDNNIICLSKGFGVYAHDASGVAVAHNLILGNSSHGIFMRNVTDRKTGAKIAETSHNRIFNNIICGNLQGAVAMPFESDRASDNLSDYNVFCCNGLSGSRCFEICWSHGGTDEETVTAACRKVLATSALISNTKPADVNLEAQQRTFYIDTWRRLMGMERQSVAGNEILSTDLRREVMTLCLHVGKAVLDMCCPAVEVVQRDFFGTMLPSEKRLPGPFQNLKDGDNHIVIRQNGKTLIQPGTDHTRTRKLSVPAVSVKLEALPVDKKK